MRYKIIIATFIVCTLSLAVSVSSDDDKATSYSHPQDQYIDVAGAKIRVRIEGPENAPPIILLHGFTFSLETWDQWAKVLTSQYQVIRYDLLGHGLTGPDNQQRYSPLERAIFIGKVMDALNIEKAIIGGNSLGGLAAWRFATLASERVEKLILVAPGGFPMNGVTDKPVLAPAPIKAFFQNPTEAGVAYSLSTLFADQSNLTQNKIALTYYMMNRPGNGDAFIQSIAVFTLPDPVPALKSINIPGIILWGKKDITVPFSHAAQFHAAMSNTQLFSYENVAHLPHEEAPAETLEDVLKFLRQGE